MGNLSFIQTKLLTVKGEIALKVERTEKELLFEIDVPPGSEAILIVPDEYVGKVWFNEVLWSTEEIKINQSDRPDGWSGYASIHITSGYWSLRMEKTN